MRTLNRLEKNIAQFVSKNPTTTIAFMYVFVIVMLMLWSN